ncbi:hypothetical protein KC992_01830 [Candidatus Saccharibacteria bacterium]|nr:hypothetical protein [Candidatus Saccharibacteria bacterium]
MIKTHSITFIFEYFSECYKQGKYISRRHLTPNDSIREAAISVMREAIKNGADVWTKDINNESSISIYLVNDEINNAGSGYRNSGFGIKYDLNNSGGIIILDGYGPLQHDWAYSRIIELVELGYIKGDTTKIIVGLPEGLGAGEEIYDFIGFLADVITVVGPSLAVVKYSKRKLNHRRIRRIVKKWAKNNIRYPHQIREFIDTKAEWSVGEVKKRLKLNEEYAIKLLSALGYEPVGNSWRLTQSKSSIRIRKNWMRNEKKYQKNN